MIVTDLKNLKKQVHMGPTSLAVMSCYYISSIREAQDQNDLEIEFRGMMVQ